MYPKDAKHNADVLVRVAELIEEVPYGTITFTLRIHNNYVTDLMVQKYIRERFEIKK